MPCHQHFLNVESTLRTRTLVIPTFSTLKIFSVWPKPACANYQRTFVIKWQFDIALTRQKKYRTDIERGITDSSISVLEFSATFPHQIHKSCHVYEGKEPFIVRTHWFSACSLFHRDHLILISQIADCKDNVQKLKSNAVRLFQTPSKFCSGIQRKRNLNSGCIDNWFP